MGERVTTQHVKKLRKRWPTHQNNQLTKTIVYCFNVFWRLWAYLNIIVYAAVVWGEVTEHGAEGTWHRAQSTAHRTQHIRLHLAPNHSITIDYIEEDPKVSRAH